MTTSVVRVRMFDGFAVELPDGRQAGPWARPSARRLVEFLLLRSGRRIGREELAEALFPNLEPKRAANSVSKALTMARSAVGEGILEANRSSVWIGEDVALSIDVEEHSAAIRAALADPSVEKLEAALTERRRLLDEDLYEDWAIQARDELERLRAQGRLELARARTAGGLPSLEMWTEVAADDPASEEACLGIVRAHGSAGRRDLVVRFYHRHRAALDELGLKPSEEVEAAYREALATGTPAVEAPPVSPRSAPLIFGRHHELDRLVTGLSRAGAVLVCGPAGIGKTHLLRAAAQRLERSGWQVLRGTAVADDRRAPYASLRIALAPLLARARDGSPPARLAHEQRAESLFDHRELALEAEEERARLAEQVGELIEGASSSSPVLLVLDDLQWADLALQSLLFRLLAQERPRRWAVVLAARSDEPQAPVPVLPTTVERIELGPLSDRDVRAVARATLGSRRLRPSDLAAIVERSVGNPFFAIELTRQAAVSAVGRSLERRRVPEAIVALLRGRVERCSPTARRMVPLVALAGAEASYELLVSVGADRALAGSPERAVRAIDELIGAHLTVETSAGVRLTHPLLRAAALAEVNALRRGALHARLADRLEALRGDAETIARHRLAAFEAGRLRARAAAAARAGFLAGGRAREVLAYDAALELLEGGLAAFEAVRADERGALRGEAVSAWLARADILLQRDDEGEGRAACESALALATTDEELARAWRSIGEIPYRHGDLAGAIEAYRSGLGALHGGSPQPRALLLCDLGWALHRMGRYEEALETLEEAYHVLESEGGPADAGFCADAIAITLSALGRRRKALSRSEEAFRLAELAGSRRLQALLHLHRAQILSGLGRPGEAMSHARWAQTVYERPRDRYKLSIVHWVLAEVRDALGDPEGALDERDLERELLLEVGNELNLSRAEAHRAQLLARLGRRRAAETAAASAREAAARVGDPDWSARVQGWLAGGKISGRVAP